MLRYIELIHFNHPQWGKLERRQRIVDLTVIPTVTVHQSSLQ
jgi:hypothetical protein